MVLLIILLVLGVSLLVINRISKKQQCVENINRCKGTYYLEHSEEIIRREKVIRRIKYVISYAFLTLFAIFMIFPFYWMINTSLKGSIENSYTDPTFFPTLGIEWNNWKYIFDKAYQIELSTSVHPITGKVVPGSVAFDVWRLMYNTLVVGIFSTIGTVVTTVMAAFAFTRIKFPGREFIFTLFLATMMIPGEMMLITNYLTVVKTLKGLNTYWAMIVPFLISVYYIYLLRQNFRQIPNELYYAAKVDGTSNFKYLLKVMIPIAMPTLITITILKLMGSWNAYMWPEMVAPAEEMSLISVGLRSSFSVGGDGTQNNAGYQMAASAAVTLPLLLVFILLRKYIMRGVSRSGIKG